MAFFLLFFPQPINHPRMLDPNHKPLEFIPKLSPKLLYGSHHRHDSLKEPEVTISNAKEEHGRRTSEIKVTMKMHSTSLDNRHPSLTTNSISRFKEGVAALNRGGAGEDEMAKFRREMMLHNMADPKYLSKKSAIERQNSLLNPRGPLLGMGASRDQHDPLQQLRNDIDDSPDKHKDAIKRSWTKILSKKKKRNHVNKKWEHSYRYGKDTAGPQGNVAGVKRSTYSFLGSFNMVAYLSAQQMEAGEGDPMKKFQFNQVASDATPPDRHLIDVRHSA